MKLYLLFVLSMISPLLAMEQEITSGATTSQDENACNLILYLANPSVMYIGHSNERTKAEKAYGKIFPLNTIFFQVTYKLKSKDISTSSLPALPDCIPYDFIKNCTENSLLTLELDNKPYTFTCLQKAPRRPWGEHSFEEVVSGAHEYFRKNCNYLSDGKQSLFDAKVIEKVDGCTKHGENSAFSQN